jgi:hypothetical protein
MREKLIRSYAVITAFAALGIAPAASASPVMTTESKAVAVGAEITGKNTGEFISTGPLFVHCGSVDLVATVTGNSGTQIKLEAEAGNFSFTSNGGECEPGAAYSFSWGKLCFESIPKTDNVAVTGCGSSATLVTNITGVASCRYSFPRFTGVVLTGGNATISFSEQEAELSEGVFACPSAWKFDFDLFLFSPAGTTLSIT